MIESMAKMEIKRILSDTITALSKSSLTFKEEIKIEGLIGITIDKTDIILININEYCLPAGESTPKKDSSSTKIKVEKEEEPPKPAQTSTEKEKETKKTVDKPIHKILSETSHKQCLQSEDSSYTEVQKSIKMVQRPEGVVEQKEVEWKKFTADGELLEQRKMEEVQPVDPVHSNYSQEDGNFHEDEAGGDPSDDYYGNIQENYEEEFCEEGYDYEDNNYTQQFPQYSRASSRGFPMRPTRGVKRQRVFLSFTKCCITIYKNKVKFILYLNVLNNIV